MHAILIPVYMYIHCLYKDIFGELSNGKTVKCRP